MLMEGELASLGKLAALWSVVIRRCGVPCPGFIMVACSSSIAIAPPNERTHLASVYFRQPAMPVSASLSVACSPTRAACACRPSPAARFGRATAAHPGASPLNKAIAANISSGSDANRTRADTGCDRLRLRDATANGWLHAGATGSCGSGLDRSANGNRSRYKIKGERERERESCFLVPRANLLKRTM